MLEERTIVDKIEILQNGTVQVREANQIVKDGAVISQNFHRYVVTPGSDYSEKDEKVRAICDTVHTEEVITAYGQGV